MIWEQTGTDKVDIAMKTNIGSIPLFFENWNIKSNYAL